MEAMQLTLRSVICSTRLYRNLVLWTEPATREGYIHSTQFRFRPSGPRNTNGETEMELNLPPGNPKSVVYIRYA